MGHKDQKAVPWIWPSPSAGVRGGSSGAALWWSAAPHSNLWSEDISEENKHEYRRDFTLFICLLCCCIQLWIPVQVCAPHNPGGRCRRPQLEHSPWRGLPVELSSCTPGKAWLSSQTGVSGPCRRNRVNITCVVTFHFYCALGLWRPASSPDLDCRRQGALTWLNKVNERMNERTLAWSQIGSTSKGNIIVKKRNLCTAWVEYRGCGFRMSIYFELLRNNKVIQYDGMPNCWQEE